MFTGLIEERGRVLSIERREGGSEIQIAAGFSNELARGESVAISGACLTVVGSTTTSFRAEAVLHTLATTTLGQLTRGAEVNLERAVRAGDRLGGHIVTGHVDGIGVVTHVDPVGRGVLVDVRIPPELARHVAPRGSIAVDGISLTVADVRSADVRIALIPETMDVTTASAMRPGARVNIETDVLAKYVERLVRHESSSEPLDRANEESGITLERLKELGF